MRWISRKKELSKELDADALQEFVSLKMNEELSVDMMFEGLSRICETSKNQMC